MPETGNENFKRIAITNILEEYREKNHMDLLVAKRHYRRMKRLIKPLIDIVNELKLKGCDKAVLEYVSALLEISYDVNTKYLFEPEIRKSKKNSNELNEIPTVQKGKEVRPENQEFKNFNDKKDMDLNSLYDKLIKATECLKDMYDAQSFIINEVDRMFKEADCMAYIRPYNGTIEYLKFINGLPDEEKGIMLNRISRYYGMWLNSVKQEYGI